MSVGKPGDLSWQQQADRIAADMLGQAIALARASGPVDPPTCIDCDARLDAWDAPCPQACATPHASGGPHGR